MPAADKALAARKIARKSDALRDVWRAAQKAKRAQVERDMTICAAADSHSYSEIATACGLSKPRVQQIVNAGR